MVGMIGIYPLILKIQINEHLLPGVSSSGVPKSLGGLTIPFEFNNEKILNKNFKISKKFKLCSFRTCQKISL